WPLSTVNETPSTARTTPSSVLKYVFRSLTSSRAIRSSGGAENRARGAPGVSQTDSSLAQPNTWVDDRVRQVDHEVEHNDAERGEHDHPLRRRQVERLDGVDGGLAEPLQPVDRLGEDRAAERDADVHAEHRHDRQQRVPEDVGAH